MGRNILVCPRKLMMPAPPELFEFYKLLCVLIQTVTMLPNQTTTLSSMHNKKHELLTLVSHFCAVLAVISEGTYLRKLQCPSPATTLLSLCHYIPLQLYTPLYTMISSFNNRVQINYRLFLVRISLNPNPNRLFWISNSQRGEGGFPSYRARAMKIGISIGQRRSTTSGRTISLKFQ